MAMAANSGLETCPLPPLEQAAMALRSFLSRHREVWLEEDGERVAHLRAADSGFSIQAEAGRLICHFWTPEANLVRRVVGFTVAGGSLRLQCIRLGRSQPSRLSLFEAGQGNRTRSDRSAFRQTVLHAVRREWPGWSPARVHASGENRSPWQRLAFHRGAAGVDRRRRPGPLLAVLAVGEDDAASADGALTQALLWAETLRQHWPQNYLQAVRLILPPTAEATAAIVGRLPWLRREIPVEAYSLDLSAGHLNQIETGGNLVSTLRRSPAAGITPGPEAQALLAEIHERAPQTTLTWSDRDSVWSFRLYGLEIAREAVATSAGGGGGFVFGYGRERSPLEPHSRPLFHHFLEALSRQRVADGDRRDPLFSLQPERWLEHLLSRDPGALDAGLDRRFCYAQVPAWNGPERDVLDLLAVTRAGRLVVIELKADEDAGFPLQALDYWLRVRQHLREGDFSRLGYFPGVELSREPPLLWLVAPALRWHAGTSRLLTWFAPEVPWTVIGINEDWRRGIQVLYRAPGPGSERMTSPPI